MTDDVIDYLSDRQTMGKNPGKDLEEGKLTLPLIIALDGADEAERSRVAGILREKQLLDGDLEWVKDLLQRRGGIRETLEESRTFLATASRQLAEFPDSQEKKALERLTERILHRMS
jgi:octaprenyl-diphosphate synthase